ncbi:ATP-binding protein [Caldibacillus debilis]|uniref:Putative ATPase n=1 Tax=Caldibacillus debilis GB1 TaxID=1339248 RepID=A0A420VDG2_9BACI|nr:ATP-binding protein [Caldibacillus debilis]RKO61681.1 putative ATPase [Caldibacillus debilis GB1]
MNRMFVLGRTERKTVILASQDAPFTLNEYLMIEDPHHGAVPVEVVDTFAYPMIAESVLPDGCAVEFVRAMKLQEDKTLFLAKADVLRPLATPVMPAAPVRKPGFEEIRDILIQTDPSKGFTLGIIEGTEQMQEELPEELKNVAPLWSGNQAGGQRGVPFFLDFHRLREYPHFEIIGTTGSGKTFGMRVLEEELMKFSIPALVFDPHQESVFRRPVKGLPKELEPDFDKKYEIFYIGKDVGIRFVELTLDELIHLFEFVGPLTDPQKAALEVLYEQGDTLAYLRQKIANLKIAFEEHEKPKREQEPLTSEQEELYAKYRNRVSGASTLQALGWKLDSLENTRIFNGDVEGVERALKSRKLAVIRGDIRRLQMLSSYVIKKFYKKRRTYQDARERGEEEEYFPMFFIVMDEAHNFAPKDRFSPVGTVLKTVALEARKYGVFLVMVTQKPNVLDETIMAQLNTKIIFRLHSKGDMDLIQRETNLTEEEMKRLPHLLSGSCFVSSPILSKNFAVRFRTTFTEAPNIKDPFEELDRFSVSKNREELAEFLLGRLPIHSGKLAALHSEANRVLSETYSLQDITDTLEDLAVGGKAVKKQSPFGIIYEA